MKGKSLNREVKRPIVAIDLSTKGQGGGPFVSTNRIINSELRKKYDFRILRYDVGLGRGISLKRILDLKKQIKSISPDIVHFTGLQLSGFHLAVACKLANIRRSVVTVRGFSGDSIDFHPLKRFLLTFVLEPVTLALTAKVYGVSKFVANRRIIRFFSKKSFGHIYNFPPKPKKKYSKEEARKVLGLRHSDIVVVSVGRINKEKGYHVLESAIKGLSNEENIVFVIAGEGDYLSQMKINLEKQVLENKVKLLGYRDDIEVINAAGDIFVLPTLHETLSLALLEASQSKLPLIASNTGGVPEIVIPGLNGLLVEPGSSSQIEEAIRKLVEDPKLRRTFGEAAYERLLKEFDSSKIVESIDNVYLELLHRKGN